MGHLPAVICLLLLAASAGRATPSLDGREVFMHADHSLTAAVPTAGSAVHDSAWVEPDQPLALFPTFRSAEPLAVLLAPTPSDQLVGGTVVAYVRPSRTLEQCVDFDLTLRAASGAEIAHAVLPALTLERRIGAVAVPFTVHPATAAGLAAEPVEVTIGVRTASPCKAATVKLLFDATTRAPGRLTLALCSAPSDAPDANGDGVPDACQLCTDTDGDGWGDPGLSGSLCVRGPDNCPLQANADQVDTDGDGIGDGCDATPFGPDRDGDGVPEAFDNCPSVPNPDQGDADGDGLGDACEAWALGDLDGDGTLNGDDNCPLLPNPDQVDADANGVGDACECTHRRPGRCIAGGGRGRTDCLLEFNPAGRVTYSRRLSRVLPRLRCRDGDPACDLDGALDGRCTFGLSVCLGNDDPRHRRCRPEAVRSVEVQRASNATRTTLEATIAALGVQVTYHGAVTSPLRAARGGNLCSGLATVVLPTPRGGGVNRRRVIVRAEGVTGAFDRDRLTLECRAR